MQTNIRQDYCSYDNKLMNSMGPGLYHINTPCNDKNECSQDITPDPYYRYQKYGYATCPTGTNILDDNELKGLNYKNSKCNTDSFLPNKYQATGNCNIRGNTNARACLNPQESTILSNPAINLKESAVNRWEWLCDDPQDRALESFDRPVNYRMVAKDNHIPLIEIPQDQSFFLPNNKYNENNPSDDIKKWNIGSATNSFAPGNPNGNLNYNLSCV